MLRYFAQGRVFWKHGMRCNTRTNWEFYAVLDGRCGVRLSDDDPPVFRNRTLWLFAPECAHAWADEHGAAYERVALHFSSVPFPLDDVVRQHGGWLERPLDDEGVAVVREIAGRLEPAYRRLTVTSSLVFQRHLSDLALLMLDGQEASGRPATLGDLVEFRTERAIDWYLSHLAENPTVKEVAEAIHVSPSHLRRLFWQSRQAGPKAVFRRLRLDHAKELMSRSSLTLEAVAAHSGYANASHLCRDCRAEYRVSATTWRKQLVRSFVRPLAIDLAAVPHLQGRRMARATAD
jgi:AraC family transcriptional regulator